MKKLQKDQTEPLMRRVAVSAKKGQWHRGYFNDWYVQGAHQHGLRARSAWKLLEIQKKYDLFQGRGESILDLGAAPGGWSQVISQLGHKVFAVDERPMEPLEGVRILQMSIQSHEDSIKALKQWIGTRVTGVVSDLSPSLTGHKATDHIRLLRLASLSLEVGKCLLKKRGFYVVKIFQGSQEADFVKVLKQSFEQVRCFKPKASRKNSCERYLIGQSFRYLL